MRVALISNSFIIIARNLAPCQAPIEHTPGLSYSKKLNSKEERESPSGPFSPKEQKRDLL
jgi:hypothetical protein